jgi:hypothetical protein
VSDLRQGRPPRPAPPRADPALVRAVLPLPARDAAPRLLLQAAAAVPPEAVSSASTSTSATLAHADSVLTKFRVRNFAAATTSAVIVADADLDPGDTTSSRPSCPVPDAIPALPSPAELRRGHPHPRRPLSPHRRTNGRRIRRSGVRGVDPSRTGSVERVDRAEPL